MSTTDQTTSENENKTEPPLTPKGSDTAKRTRQITSASLIMVSAIFLSRILGQVRDTVFSAMFGLNIHTDIYRSAFALPDVLYFLIAGGALSSSFIPVFSEYLYKDKPEEAWKIFSVVATIMAIFVTAAVIICEIFAVPLIMLLRSGFDAQQVAQTAYLTRILLPAQLAFFLGGLMFATLYARKHFLTPALGPIIYNLGIIIGGVCFVKFTNSGIEGFAWGALIGAICGNLIMPIAVLYKFGIRYKWSLDISHPGVKQVLRLMLPVIFGLSLPAIYGLVNGWNASFLRDGAISALDQANKIMQAPLGIFGQGLAVAVFPTLNELIAKNDLKGYSDTLNKSIRSILFITIPISFALAILSLDVIRILFQYGRFDSSASSMTSSALIFYCVGIFAWSALAVIQRGFYAMQDTKTPIIVGTAATALFIPLSFAASKFFDFPGLAFATSIAAVLQAVVLILILSKRAGNLNLANIALSVVKVLIASVIMSAAIIAVRYGLSRIEMISRIDDRLESVLYLLFAGGIGTIIYLITTRLQNMEEVNWALSGIFKRFRREK